MSCLPSFSKYHPLSFPINLVILLSLATCQGGKGDGEERGKEEQKEKGICCEQLLKETVATPQYYLHKVTNGLSICLPDSSAAI